MAKQQPKDEETNEVAFWDVDETLKSYGRDRLLRSQAEGQYTGMIKFLSDNSMLKKTRRAIDANGKLLIRQVFGSDLTVEGVAFVKAAHEAWFGSKASARDPCDITLLAKYLKESARIAERGI